MGRSNFTLHRANECEHVEDHTACPDGYIQWHAWADEMRKTHKQGVYVVCKPTVQPVRYGTAEISPATKAPATSAVSSQ